MIAALLKLRTKIQFNDKTRPLCVNSRSDLSKVQGIVSGWGWTNENFEIGKKPDNLQRALVPVWDNFECQESYKGQGLKNNISSSQLCAGFKDGKIDSCWVIYVYLHRFCIENKGFLFVDNLGRFWWSFD